MMNKNYYAGTSRKFMGLGVMFKVDPPYTTVRRSWLFELCLGWFKFWYIKEKKNRGRMNPLKDDTSIKPNTSGPEKEIQRFMQSHSSFKEQDDCQGKRFVFTRNGTDVAYIWFKYGLNGWNLLFYNQSNNGERTHIESVEKLKIVLKINLWGGEPLNTSKNARS